MDKFWMGMYLFFLGYTINVLLAFVFAAWYFEDKKIGHKRMDDLLVALSFGLGSLLYIYWRYEIKGGVIVFRRWVIPQIKNRIHSIIETRFTERSQRNPVPRIPIQLAGA